MSEADSEPTPASLWRDVDFVRFWLGQSVSLFGSQFTILALPLTALLILHADAVQMGLLNALQYAPGLVTGLAAGVWLDRVPRRPVMVVAQLVSAAALLTIPLAAVTNVLRLPELYAVVLVTGTAATFINVAQSSFLPTLVRRDQLMEAANRFQFSRTLAELLGPGAAGTLIQLLSAPIVVTIDAASFLVGAATAAWVGVQEQPRQAGRRHMVAEAREGIAWLWRSSMVRSVTLSLLLANFGANVAWAIFVLLFVGQLGLTPTQLGIAFATLSLSALAGSRLTSLLSRRRRIGASMVGSCLLLFAGRLGDVTAAFGPRPLVFPLLLLGSAVAGLGLMTYNVNQQALRQALIPDRLLGRVQAGNLMLVWAGQVVGSLAGGALGQAVSLRTSLVVGAVITGTCVVPVLTSPLRSLRDLPARAEP